MYTHTYIHTYIHKHEYIHSQHVQSQDFSSAAKRASSYGVSYMIGSMPKTMLGGRRCVQMFTFMYMYTNVWIHAYK